jgi:hypothetical protein
MRFTSETTSNGVSERLFILDNIPGVLWSPADAAGSRPLVLLGHGGGQHKKVPGLVGPRPPLRDGLRLRGGGHRRARARRPAEN